MEEKNYLFLKKQQFWILALITLMYLYAAPMTWMFTPDGGIYIGTALSLLENFTYTFNFHPNILYYPGYSLLLTLPISVFGLDFHVIHLYAVLFSLLALWLSKSYYSTPKYGIAGLILPIILSSVTVFQAVTFKVLSDNVFLALLMLTLVLWRKFEKTDDYRILLGCLLIVSFSSLVRFQGVFLCFAFTLALLLYKIENNGFTKKTIFSTLLYGLVSILPFVFWSYRNYILHDPDTYNMFNRFLFKLKGLDIYAPNSFKSDWVDAKWKYGIYNLIFSLQALFESFFGSFIKMSLTKFIAFMGCFSLLITPGLYRWFKLSNNFERLTFFCLLSFTLYWHLRSNSLYTVTRYWIPLLPFLILVTGLSIREFLCLVKNVKIKTIIQSMAIFVSFLALSHGAHNYINSTNAENSIHYSELNNNLNKMRLFVDDNLEPDVRISTTDWGIIPFSLMRESYPILNDKTHRFNIERIIKYKTSFLAIVDGTSKEVPYGKELVLAYPEIFTLVFETGSDPLAGYLYAINLTRLEQEFTK